MKKILKRGIMLILCITLILSQTTVSMAAKYEYDSLNRLVKVTYDNGDYTCYTYDKAGNITKIEKYKKGQKPEPTPPGGSESGGGSIDSGGGGLDEGSIIEPEDPDKDEKPDSPIDSSIKENIVIYNQYVKKVVMGFLNKYLNSEVLAYLERFWQ